MSAFFGQILCQMKDSDDALMIENFYVKYMLSFRNTVYFRKFVGSIEYGVNLYLQTVTSSFLYIIYKQTINSGL